LNLALPGVSQTGGVNAFSTGNVTQPGQAYTQAVAGGTFGLLRQTVGAMLVWARAASFSSLCA
jgi:hypothetical protein